MTNFVLDNFLYILISCPTKMGARRASNFLFSPVILLLHFTVTMTGPFWWDFDMGILYGDSGCHHKLCGHFGKRRWNLTTWKIERSKDPGRDSSIPWDILMYRDITNVWYIYGYSHFSSGISCFFILHKLFSPLSPK